jgi:glycosyltransferase involved in cell wall biosynthesis
MRVGLEFPFSRDSWIGGANIISNLLNAVSVCEGMRISLVLTASPKTPARLLRDVPDVEILTTPFIEPSTFSHGLRRLNRRVAGSDPIMTSWLKAKKIDVLAYCESLGRRSGVPTIGHIADFGPFHFPEHWPAAALKGMEAALRRVFNDHDAIIVHSRSVKDEYERRFPDVRAAARVVRVVPSHPILDIEADARDLDLRKHRLPERFFYAPNQFWAHKNHGAIIEAVAILRDRGVRVDVVSTGATHDPRNPAYFGEILELIRKLGVGDRIHILGVAPYTSVIKLFKLSLAVLNSSLFEGFGISVAEASALGKTVLVSDIPVLREHEAPHALYFDPREPAELADLMECVQGEYLRPQDLDRQRKASRRRRQLISDFAHAFEDVVLETYEGKQRSGEVKRAYVPNSERQELLSIRR